MQLGKLYTEIEPEWCKFLNGRRALTFYVPTETVVYAPRIVTPAEARAFHTGLYLRDGEAVPYDEIARDPNFVGTYRETEIMLVEVWTDRGDDGHVFWVHTGWRFVPAFTLHFRSRSYATKEQLLPEPMLMQFWDYETG
jgi:hypothetical protein